MIKFIVIAVVTLIYVWAWALCRVSKKDEPECKGKTCGLSGNN